jgi:hypothetical protein
LAVEIAFCIENPLMSYLSTLGQGALWWSAGLALSYMHVQTEFDLRIAQRARAPFTVVV